MDRVSEEDVYYHIANSCEVWSGDGYTFGVNSIGHALVVYVDLPDGSSQKFYLTAEEV